MDGSEGGMNILKGHRIARTYGAPADQTSGPGWNPHVHQAGLHGNARATHTPQSFAALLRDGDPADMQAAFDAVHAQRCEMLAVLRDAVIRSERVNAGKRDAEQQALYERAVAAIEKAEGAQA